MVIPAIGGGINVLSGCAASPSRISTAARAAPPASTASTPAAAAHAVPLGPEMARGALSTGCRSRRSSSPTRDRAQRPLITCLLPQHPILHLCGLSILGGATAGARKLIEDPLAVNFAHFEYFGRPFAVAAELHPEHKDLLDDFLEPQYAQRYGRQVAALVQKSFLRDVVQPDLACVACNELRPPDAWVTRHLKRLYQSSPFDDVRQMANAIHSHFYSIAKTGRLNESGEKVASEKHMQMLYDELLDGLPGGFR